MVNWRLVGVVVVAFPLLKKKTPVSQPEANPKIRSFRSHFLDNTFQRENPMSEITSLVTAEAV
ncbi:hypothetical protein JVB15_25095, partial [Escherichia coli]|nr:hypothetical protein [Escherichia coli]